MSTKNHLQERRRHRRYLITGSASFSPSRVSGEVRNISEGGLLISGRTAVPDGSDVHVHFTIDRYPEKFEARAVVFHSEQGTSLTFQEEPRGISQLLSWLDQEHCSWSGPALFKKAG